MTNIVQYLADLRQIGVRLWLDDGALRYEAPKGRLSAEAIAEMRGRKAEIVDFLSEIGEGSDVAAPTPRPRPDGRAPGRRRSGRFPAARRRDARE